MLAFFGRLALGSGEDVDTFPKLDLERLRDLPLKVVCLVCSFVDTNPVDSSEYPDRVRERDLPRNAVIEAFFVVAAFAARLLLQIGGF